MKDILKLGWRTVILRFITIIFIVIGSFIYATGAFWFGFFIQLIGWILNFQFYEYKSPNQKDNDKDDFNLQEPYFD